MDSSEWSGRVGDVWAEEWRRTDRSFVPVDAALVDAAVARVSTLEAPRIVDVGCGAGTTSLSLAARLPAANIVGVDLSQALIAVARSRVPPDGPVCFEQGDASTWAGQTGVDLLVSRHGVMFFADPVGAFSHLRSLVRSGGGIVFSCFRSPALNVWASGLAHLMPKASGDPHAPGPFAFADRDHVARILNRAGWRDAEAQALDVDYVAGSGADPVTDAIDYFRRIGPVARALRDLDESGRSRLEQGLADLVRQHRDGDRVSFPAAIWIWSATA
ncbi:class I SAM-dependent methyltransferase [Sphingomonas sp.]|jgi:SAM-dependent methyltransferase|uniref:class I SAM-dependent methyltransferase n=1 Tax=Sphingomonas sp. TaxID=28214 RepID=UPI002DE8D2B4|nr:class I SAM-dependent methyltransferase [Sphingomonas sp.]